MFEKVGASVVAQKSKTRNRAPGVDGVGSGGPRRPSFVAISLFARFREAGSWLLGSGVCEPLCFVAIPGVSFVRSGAFREFRVRARVLCLPFCLCIQVHGSNVLLCSQSVITNSKASCGDRFGLHIIDAVFVAGENWQECYDFEERNRLLVFFANVS